MKVAVLVSGMLRTFEETYPRFEKYIIDDLEPDIFFYGYPNKKGINYCEDKIKQLWNPKDYKIVEYTYSLRKKICLDENKYEKNKRPETKVNNVLSAAYALKNCNDLRLKYQNDNHIDYDIVLRIRSDYYFINHINQSQLESAKKGEILIPNEWDFKEVHPLAVSDGIALSNNFSINKYCELYNHIDNYFDEGIMFHPETYFGVHIDRMNLVRKEIYRHGWIDFHNPDGDDINRKEV
jgi:hypothetical protein